MPPGTLGPVLRVTCLGTRAFALHQRRSIKQISGVVSPAHYQKICRKEVLSAPHRLP